MSVKVITHFSTLMRLARAVGDAEKTGDAALIKKAHAEHDAYKKLCLAADQMHLGCTKQQLG